MMNWNTTIFTAMFVYLVTRCIHGIFDVLKIILVVFVTYFRVLLWCPKVFHKFRKKKVGRKFSQLFPLTVNSLIVQQIYVLKKNFVRVIINRMVHIVYLVTEHNHLHVEHTLVIKRLWSEPSKIPNTGTQSPYDRSDATKFCETVRNEINSLIGADSKPTSIRAALMNRERARLFKDVSPIHMG